MTRAADHPGEAAGRAGRHAMAIARVRSGGRPCRGPQRKPEYVRKHEGKGNVIEPSRIRVCGPRAWGGETNAEALAGEPSGLGLRNEGVSDDALEDQRQPTPRLEERPETALPRREVVGTNPECALKSKQ